MGAVKAFFVTLLMSLILIGDHGFTAKLNIRKCKLTHSGIEYRGNVFTTKNKSLCRPWDSIGVRMFYTYTQIRLLFLEDLPFYPSVQKENVKSARKRSFRRK